MRVERSSPTVWPRVWVNQKWEEPMPEAKPYDIPKQLVWEAYQRVKANRGAAGVDGGLNAELVTAFVAALPASIKNGDKLDLLWVPNRGLEVRYNDASSASLGDLSTFRAVFDSALGPNAPSGIPEAIFGRRPDTPFSASQDPAAQKPKDAVPQR